LRTRPRLAGRRKAGSIADAETMRNLALALAIDRAGTAGVR
jgi:hypothetical protein